MDPDPLLRGFFDRDRSQQSASRAPSIQAWEQLLARFHAAPFELLLQRELRRRTDSKFVLTHEEAAGLLPALTRDYAVLLAGVRPVAWYRTLYFDTEELDFFHAQRRGRRVRHKVRIRHYPDRRVTFLEVKKRTSEWLTTKIRRERDYADDELRAEDQTFVAGHTGIGQSVLAQAWTDFRRITLLGLRTPERITIDLDLGLEMGERMKFLPRIAIVEVKQWPHSRRTPVMAALRAAGWRPGWASKYCAAVAFTHPMVRFNELLPGIRNLERGAA